MQTIIDTRHVVNLTYVYSILPEQSALFRLKLLIAFSYSSIYAMFSFAYVSETLPRNRLQRVSLRRSPIEDILLGASVNNLAMRSSIILHS